MLDTDRAMTVDAKTIAVYDAKAADYAARFDTDEKPGAHLLRFINALPKDAHVLDLGCGPGTAAGHMSAAGLKVDAVDASAQMVRAANFKDGVTARQASFDDLNAHSEYHGVWANFSLLHAPRDHLLRHLEAIAHSLRDRGLFHIGMKTGTGAQRDRLERMYTFVSGPELRGLLETAGFEILAQDTGHEVGLAGTDDWWIVLMAQKAARVPSA